MLLDLHLRPQHRIWRCQGRGKLPSTRDNEISSWLLRHHLCSAKSHFRAPRSQKARVEGGHPFRVGGCPRWPRGPDWTCGHRAASSGHPMQFGAPCHSRGRRRGRLVRGGRYECRSGRIALILWCKDEERLIWASGFGSCAKILREWATLQFSVDLVSWLAGSLPAERPLFVQLGSSVHTSERTLWLSHQAQSDPFWDSGCNLSLLFGASSFVAMPCLGLAALLSGKHFSILDFFQGLVARLWVTSFLSVAREQVLILRPALPQAMNLCQPLACNTFGVFRQGLDFRRGQTDVSVAQGRRPSKEIRWQCKRPAPFAGEIQVTSWDLPPWTVDLLRGFFLCSCG